MHALEVEEYQGLIQEFYNGGGGGGGTNHLDLCP